MTSIETLVEEHNNIARLLEVVRSAGCHILDGGYPNTEDFRTIAMFARHYADHYHHGKEEEILFREMTSRLGTVAENLIRHGMLVEHDLGRMYVQQLLDACDAYDRDPCTSNSLNILSAALGYAGTLRRHMDKENQAVYTFAESTLPADVLEQITEEVNAFDRLPENAETKSKYLILLEKLEEQYPPVQPVQQ